MKQKIPTFLGICGSFSCYIAMYPAMLVSIIGILGVSTASLFGIFAAYQHSSLFQPIFIVSLILLLYTLYPYGTSPFRIVLIGTLGVFVSMNVYMRQWIFILSFILIAVGYFLAYRKSGNPSLRLGCILFLLVVLLGIVDIVRVLFSSSSTQLHQPVNEMNTMKR